MKCSRLWIFGMLVGYMASSFDEFKVPSGLVSQIPAAVVMDDPTAMDEQNAEL